MSEMRKQTIDKQEIDGQKVDKQEVDRQKTDRQEIDGQKVDMQVAGGQKNHKQEAHGQKHSAGMAAGHQEKSGASGRIWKKALDLKPDPQEKQIALLAIQDAIEAKRIRNIPSPAELIQIQLQYITPSFWALQGGLLLLLILLLHRLPGQNAELTDYLWWSSIAAAWMGVLSNGVLGRHFSCRMAELEQSCYMNLSQMWTIRMTLTTGVDIGILTVFSGGIAARTETFFGRVAMYLLVPFLLSNVCCLLMISALRSGRRKYTLAALAVITALLAVSPCVVTEAYTTAYLWVWFCLLVLGAAVFAGQIKSCYGRMTRGEMICWN